MPSDEGDSLVEVRWIFADVAIGPSRGLRATRAPSTRVAASASARRSGTLPLLPISPRREIAQADLMPGRGMERYRAAKPDLEVVGVRPEHEEVRGAAASVRAVGVMRIASAAEAEGRVRALCFTKMMTQQDPACEVRSRQ